MSAICSHAKARTRAPRKRSAFFAIKQRNGSAAFAAALGGLDTLVFAGGIGENSAPIRTRICEGLRFIGIDLDETRNATHAPLISRETGRVAVRVIPTDEESVIARMTMEAAMTQD